MDDDAPDEPPAPDAPAITTAAAWAPLAAAVRPEAEAERPRRPQPQPLPRLYPEMLAYAAARGLTPIADAWPREAPGARPPQVRAGVRRRAAPEAVPQALLEEMVDSLHIEAGGERTPQFVVTFREALLGNVRCVLQATPQGLFAALIAEDAHTQRLLEAEAPRLRAQLEERGLKVVEVRVQAGTDAP